LPLKTAGQQLRTDPIQKWLSQLRQRSQIVYKPYFTQYLEWQRKSSPEESPESLLEKAKDINWLDDNLRSWYQHVKDQGVEHSTRKSKYVAVRSFYRWNNIALPKAPREWMLSAYKEPDRTYTQTEITSMFECAESSRDEALLLSLNGCPQRIEVLRALMWGMVAEEVMKGGIAIVNVPPNLPDSQGINCNKNATKYRFALLSEATWKIQQMMRERREDGERISASSWLFRGYSTKRTKNPIRIAKDSESVPLSSRAIEELISKMAERAGIQQYYKTAKQTKALFHPHGFRRTFKAHVREVWRKIKAPIDSDFLKFVIGDKLDYGGAYDKFSEPLLRDIFKELEPYLSITSYFKRQEVSKPLTVKTANSGLLYSLFLELKDMYKS
jgi:integrase